MSFHIFIYLYIYFSSILFSWVSTYLFSCWFWHHILYICTVYVAKEPTTIATSVVRWSGLLPVKLRVTPSGWSMLWILHLFIHIFIFHQLFSWVSTLLIYSYIYFSSIIFMSFNIIYLLIYLFFINYIHKFQHIYLFIFHFTSNIFITYLFIPYFIFYQIFSWVSTYHIFICHQLFSWVSTYYLFIFYLSSFIFMSFNIFIYSYIYLSSIIFMSFNIFI